MKKTLLVILIFFTTNIYAQVSIGKNIVDGNGILDFGTDNKGILLPVVNVSSSTSYENGTILMDFTDMKLKVMQNSAWLELSDSGSLLEQKDESNNTITTNRIMNTSQEDGEGVVIGAETSSAKGVLVLEATDKALILPKVNKPHENILSPAAGTIVYDTESKSLAVFDGIVWSYWK
ncbi:hypothetical protein [Empedobacter tilapiae]